jgi:hypothetical protein
MATTQTVSANGDVFIACFSLSNTGADTCHLTQGSLTIPSGLELDSIDLHGIGAYNYTTNTWVIGDLAGSTGSTISKAEACFQLKVTDVTLAVASTFTTLMSFTTSCSQDVTDDTSMYVIAVTATPCPNDAFIQPLM